MKRKQLSTVGIVLGLTLAVLMGVKSSAAAEFNAAESMQATLRGGISRVSEASMRITDETEKIRVEVPARWDDVAMGEWIYQGRKVGVYLAASSELGEFNALKRAAGVFIGVSHELTQQVTDKGLLALEQRAAGRQCQGQGRQAYRNNFYAGAYDHYTQCGGGGHQVIAFTTTSADQQQLILVRLVVVTEADAAAAARVLETFQVLGNPEVDDHHE